jgi:hypothetical protein
MTEVALERSSRPNELLDDLLVREARQRPVSDGVRADVEARPLELRNPSPSEKTRVLQERPVGDDVHRRRHAQAPENRRCVVEHVRVTVVEGDDERPAWQRRTFLEPGEELSLREGVETVSLDPGHLGGEIRRIDGEPSRDRRKRRPLPIDAVVQKDRDLEQAVRQQTRQVKETARRTSRCASETRPAAASGNGDRSDERQSSPEGEPRSALHDSLCPRDEL